MFFLITSHYGCEPGLEFNLRVGEAGGIVSHDIPAKKRQAEPAQLQGYGEREYMNHKERPVADWTLMVYVGSTAVLDSFAVESLKQMKRAAGEGVIVAAQFDASGHDEIRRLIFDGTGDLGGSIEDNVVERFVPDNSEDPSVFLEDFIAWAYARPNCRAKRYCLVLWTDGSLSPAPATDEDSQEVRDSRRRQNFLLPVELRATLEKVRATGQKKFDIIAMDACNMSMIEDVYELRDCAEFLIASEEEIPDSSCPYEQLLPLFRKPKDETTLEICRKIAIEYKRAYQDYISNESTGLKKVTLSCLQLDHVNEIKEPLDELSQALLSAIEDANTRKAIIAARQGAKSFIAGLFADAFGFCDQLLKELTARNIANKGLESACVKLCHAISTPDVQARLVVENQTSEPHRCHGLSIYFPYSTEAEKVIFNQFHVAKGGTDLLNKGGDQGIAQIEAYYETLQLAKDTHWDEFIGFGWSRCLIKEMPLELNVHYSAQQCAIHLDRYLNMLEENSKGASVAA